MEYRPQDAAQMYRDSIAQNPMSTAVDKQLLYYDPSIHQYWDPKKDAHLSAKEVIALMHKSQSKVVIRFDHKFPN
jgi:hypothetical protein